VSEIGNDETMVVCFLARNTNTVSANAVGIERGFGVDAHVDLVVIELYQAL
jgi:hypothetical protein